MLAVISSFVVAGLAAVSLTTYYAAANAKIELAEEYQHDIVRVKPGIVSALRAHDTKRLNETLESIRRTPAVIRVGFRDVSETVDFVSETPIILAAPNWFASLCDTRHMTGQHRLTANDVYFGLLTLDLSPIPFINLAWERTQQQMLILSLALGMVFVSIWLVLRSSLKPLQELLKGTHVLSEGDYSVRLAAQGSPELRRNIIGFNRMANVLEQAKKRNAEVLDKVSMQLQQQGSFANALLEAQASAGVGLAVLNDEKVILANKAALGIFGLSQEEFENVAISSMVDSEYRSEFKNHYFRILQGEILLSPRIEVKLAKSDGEERWVELALFGISRNSKYLVAVLGMDISQRKRDSQQLMKAHEILRTQKEEAELTSEAKSRFIAAASHDLRQPLLALTLFSERLKYLATTSGQSRLAGQIAEAAGNLSDLLESLLDISKIDLASVHPDIHPIELSTILDRVATLHRHEADAKQLRMHVAKTSLWILSDPNLFFRIVSNLVSNAIRYTERGSIVIGARRVSDQVRIEIWDTGIGIEENHLPLLFQEFYQIDNPERDSKNGLGLGLAIVERLIKILGHKIGVRSTSGAGSVFSVLAPRATHGNIVQYPQSRGNQTVRILLASNRQSKRTELAQMLNSWGYTVTVCQKDEITKTLLDAFTPDLIIYESPCIDCPEQVHDIFLPRVIPVICVMDEEWISRTVDVRHSCTAHAVSLKPAKLRALILHLLAQREETD